MSSPWKIPEEQLVSMIRRITVSWCGIHCAICQLFVELANIRKCWSGDIFKLRSGANQLELTEVFCKEGAFFGVGH